MRGTEQRLGFSKGPAQNAAGRPRLRPDLRVILGTPRVCRMGPPLVIYSQMRVADVKGDVNGIWRGRANGGPKVAPVAAIMVRNGGPEDGGSSSAIFPGF